MFKTEKSNRIIIFLISFALLQIGIFGCKIGEEDPSEDQSAPTVTDREIMVYSNNPDNLSLRWKRAVDDRTLYSQIVYSLYYSSETPLNSVENVKLYGARLIHTTAEGALGTQLEDVDITNVSPLTNLTQRKTLNTANLSNLKTSEPGGEHSNMTLKITGLSSGTSYYFNIIAEDEAGNQTLYSLANPTTNLASNVEIIFNPISGSYDQDQFILISTDPSEGTTIFYSTDPDADKSTFIPYTTELPIQGQDTEVTIRTYASKFSFANTAIVTSTYQIDYNKVSTPQFSVPAGTYTSAQSVSISTATIGAEIYYTTDGSIPTTLSTNYSGSVLIDDVSPPNYVTLRAIAVKTGKNDSNIQSGGYIIDFPTAEPPQFSLGSVETLLAGASGPFLNLSSATSGAEIYYTTDGSIPTESSLEFTSDVTLDTQKYWTIKARAFKSGMYSSALVVQDYNVFPTPPQLDHYTSPACDLSFYDGWEFWGKCYNSLDVTMDSSTPGSSFYYTLDDTEPTVDSSSASFVTVPQGSKLRAKTLHSIFGFSVEPKMQFIWSINEIVATPSRNPTYQTYSTSCPITIQLDSSTDNVTYKWKLNHINSIGVSDTYKDVTNDTFVVTHSNISDHWGIRVVAKKWDGTDTLYIPYGYKCTSI